MINLNLLMIILLFCFFSKNAFAETEIKEMIDYCSSPGSYAESMTFSTLKNNGILDHESIDWKKTKVIALATEKIGKYKNSDLDLYRQTNYIQYTKKSGGFIRAISVNDMSVEECSMNSIEIFLISDYFPSMGMLPTIPPLINGIDPD